MRMKYKEQTELSKSHLIIFVFLTKRTISREFFKTKHPFFSYLREQTVAAAAPEIFYKSQRNSDKMRSRVQVLQQQSKQPMMRSLYDPCYTTTVLPPHTPFLRNLISRNRPLQDKAVVERMPACRNPSGTLQPDFTGEPKKGVELSTDHTL